jgi:hypothetical protein
MDNMQTHSAARMKAGLTAMIGVDYDELKPETFRAFEVTVYNPYPTVLATRRFQDFEQAEKYALGLAGGYMALSSVDNFIADLQSAGTVKH